MPQLSFLADEHVPSVVVNALRSSGVTVVTVQDRFGHGGTDRTILRRCENQGLVVITNDRDFVRLDNCFDHAGLLVYTDGTRVHSHPNEVVDAVSRVDHHYSPSEIRNVVEWLDNWM